MQKYKADQTGPKTQSGGFQLGFVRLAYQVAIFGAVTAPPVPAAAKQTARTMARPSQERLGVMIKPPLAAVSRPSHDPNIAAAGLGRHFQTLQLAVAINALDDRVLPRRAA